MIDHGVTHDCTDLRNAERVVEMHGAEFRHVQKWQKDLTWDGKRWCIDDSGAALRLAANTARVMVAEALTELQAAQRAFADAKGSGDEQGVGAAERRMGAANRLFQHAVRTQNASKLHAMLDLARADASIAIHHQDLDADPWLLNVANGTIDLRSGKLRPHDPADRITKLAPVAYDGGATCPTWDAFLDRAMAHNAELVAFLRRLVGYALTGETREHVLAFLYGGGANGKSTFVSMLHVMLGDYAVRAPRGLLFEERYGQHTTGLTTLFGARFVSCAEIPATAVFDEALVKDLTGGDIVTARRMREDDWSWAPTHKLFIAGNYKPTVRGEDEGIWRRLRILPWTVTIPEAERDSALPEKLRAELSGILAWAVRGCLEWQRDGLGAPAEVTRATEGYRDESDVLGEFLRLYVTFDPEATIARKMIRTAYEEYARENGLTPVGAKRFAGKLRGNGVTETTVRLPNGKGADGWRGVRLLNDAERFAAATWARKDQRTCEDQIQVSPPREDYDLRTNRGSVLTSPLVLTDEDEDFAEERRAIQEEAGA